VAVSVATRPPVEPVTVAEARDHCRLVATGSPESHPDDSFLERAIQAAREKAESYMQRSIIETTFEWTFDRFEDRYARLTLPRDPVLNVSQILYNDSNGDQQTFTAFTEQLTEAKSIIAPNWQSEWPDARGHLGDVTIQFTAGYEPDETQSPTDYRANVPASIKNAILLLVGHMYENREAVMVDSDSNKLQFAFESLLWPYRLVGV
jgi:uncharacterized phiE125 gp8 family phage protein